MQVAFHLAGEITQVLDAIPWVRCASGNVSWQVHNFDMLLHFCQVKKYNHHHYNYDNFDNFDNFDNCDNYWQGHEF